MHNKAVKYIHKVNKAYTQIVKPNANEIKKIARETKFIVV